MSSRSSVDFTSISLLGKKNGRFQKKMMEQFPFHKKNSGVLSFFLWNILWVVGGLPTISRVHPPNGTGLHLARLLGDGGTWSNSCRPWPRGKTSGVGRWDDWDGRLVCRCSCNGFFRKMMNDLKLLWHTER